MVIDAAPPFFVGLLLILAFSVELGWLPIFGALPQPRASGIGFVVEVAERLVLPLVTLTLGYLGSVYLVATRLAGRPGGTLMGGAPVVETVFSYPGLGRLIYESVLARDYYPLLQGAFLLLAIGVLLANFIADLLYPLLDPRVRRRGTRAG